MTRLWIVGAVVIAVIVAVAFVAGGKPETSLTVYAQRMVDACAQADYRPLCYEKQAPLLMDEGLTMEETFDVVRILQELDPSYRYCHVLAHNVSAKEAAKDLSLWKDVIARAPSGMCGNGALHGAFQERFRVESLPERTASEIAEELFGVCDPRDSWQPTFLERSSCMHGVGHLTMYVTDADLPKSIAVCELVAHASPAEDFRRTCVDGAFMQVFQPLDPDDESLVERIAPERTERLSFCARFDGLARTSCIKESWPLAQEALEEPAALSAFCDGLSGEERRYCVSGVTYVAFGRFEFDTDRMRALCDATTGDIRAECFARVAYRLVDTDWREIPHALSFCESVPDDARDGCFSALTDFAGMGLRQGSSEARELCGGMPQEWAGACAERANVTL